MKQIFFILAFWLPVCLSAQLQESFQGPDVTSAYPWQGQVDHFKILTGTLQLDALPTQSPTSLSIPSCRQLSNEWRCTVRSDYKWTYNNYISIYMYTREADPKLPGEALFLRLGYSKKRLQLCSLVDYGDVKVLAAGRENLFEENVAVTIRVVSDAEGGCVVFSKRADETDYQQEFEVTNCFSRDRTGYFMLTFYFSQKHATDKYVEEVFIREYSDVAVEEPNEPQEPDEPLEPEDPQEPDEPQEPEEPELPEEPQQPAEPEQPVEPEVPDLPTAIPAGAILINEVMAKPGESVYPEYVELYNHSELAYSLAECRFLTGEKTKTLPDMTLPAGGYAVLHHTQKPVNGAMGSLDVSIDAFPALNDQGKTLQLLDAYGSVVDQVTYAKATAGKAWERTGNEWYLSSDPTGGTPGKQNSLPLEEDTPQPDQPQTPDEPVTPDLPDGYEIAPKEIIFNELLPDPFAGGSEYIELYNRTDRYVSLRGLILATRKSDGSLSTHYPLSSIQQEMAPYGYALLSKNIEGVTSFYTIENASVLHELKLPILVNTTCDLVLFRRGDQQVIDEVAYSQKWHVAGLRNEKGVALERISSEADSQSSANWSSATQAAGFGTPGYANSVQSQPDAEEQPTGIEAPVFSELTNSYSIVYRLDETGYYCQAYLFDTAGRRVATLANHEWVGSYGELHWDGTGTHGNRLHPGPYILYITFYHPEGKVKQFKQVFLVH